MIEVLLIITGIVIGMAIMIGYEAYKYRQESNKVGEYENYASPFQDEIPVNASDECDSPESLYETGYDPRHRAG